MKLRGRPRDLLQACCPAAEYHEKKKCETFFLSPGLTPVDKPGLRVCYNKHGESIGLAQLSVFFRKNTEYSLFRASAGLNLHIRPFQLGLTHVPCVPQVCCSPCEPDHPPGVLTLGSCLI